MIAQLQADEVRAADGLSALFADHGERRTLPRRACLHRGGDPLRSIFLVANGWMARIRIGTLGSESFMGVYMAGDIIGLDALDHGRFADEIAALTPCALLRLPMDDLRRALRGDPSAAADAIRRLGADAGFLREALFAIGTQSSTQRLATFLLQTHDRLVASGQVAAGAAQWELPLTQSQLAGVLGLTGVHVNRVLGALKARGLVDLRGGMVRRFDREGLRLEARRPA